MHSLFKSPITGTRPRLIPALHRQHAVRPAPWPLAGGAVPQSSRLTNQGTLSQTKRHTAPQFLTWKPHSSATNIHPPYGELTQRNPVRVIATRNCDLGAWDQAQYAQHLGAARQRFSHSGSSKKVRILCSPYVVPSVPMASISYSPHSCVLSP